MKKVLFVIFVAVVLVGIFLITDGSGSPGKGSGRPVEDSAHTEALVSWNEGGQIAQEAICQIYNDPLVTRDYLMRQMIMGENAVSIPVAEAKLEILEQEC